MTIKVSSHVVIPFFEADYLNVIDGNTLLIFRDKKISLEQAENNL